MPVKIPVRKPSARVQFVSGVDPNQRLGLRSPAYDPVVLLELKRADTAACASVVQGIAQKLGADRSITELNQQREPTRVGVSLAAELRLSACLAGALDDCPSVAKAAGLTGAELRAETATIKEANYLGGHCVQLGRGARQASFVLGHGIMAVLDVSRDGLVGLINQGGAPDVVAAARADHERIDGPLQAEVQRRSGKAQDTLRAKEGLEQQVEEADGRARFTTVLAAVRAGDTAALTPEDILWAHAYLLEHPVAAPAAGGAAKDAKGAKDAGATPPVVSNRRVKGR